MVDTEKMIIVLVLFMVSFIGFLNFEQFFIGYEKLLLFTPVILIAGFLINQ